MTFPNISDSNKWVPVWSGNFTAPTAPGNRKELEPFFPIPDIFIPNELDAELLAFHAYSENPTRQKIAASVRRKYNINVTEIENSETVTDSQQLLLNQLSLVKFPKEFESSYSLMVSVPYWIRELSLFLWIYSETGNSIALNNYQSPGDTNGIIYYLGTTAINSQTFVNPVPTQVVATSSGVNPDGFGGEYFELNKATDRNLNTGWHASSATPPRSQIFQLDFQNRKVDLTRIVIRPWARKDGLPVLSPTIVERSDDGLNWTVIHSFTSEAFAGQNLISPELQASGTPSRYIRFRRNNSGEWWQQVLGEIELYGFLYL
jgi:hypothetical protein